MPRVKLSPIEQGYICMKSSINKHMEIMQIGDDEMARVTGLSKARFASKRLKPELFTFPEALSVIRKLKFSDEEIREVLRGL